MSLPSSPEVTALLRSWSQGDERALEQLVPLVHTELHRLAHAYMSRERDGHTLQTTALINEAFLRLAKSGNTQWQDRAHFFGISASIMRRILVDFARSRLNQKRGGGARRLALEDVVIPDLTRPDVVALDDALSTLASLDERKAKIVELRFFGGLTTEETAEVLHISTATVTREWSLARVWLLRELKATSDP